MFIQYAVRQTSDIHKVGRGTVFLDTFAYIARQKDLLVRTTTIQTTDRIQLWRVTHRQGFQKIPEKMRPQEMTDYKVGTLSRQDEL